MNLLRQFDISMEMMRDRMLQAMRGKGYPLRLLGRGGMR